MSLPPSTASADCGRTAPSRDLRDYRGQAFIGRIQSVERGDGAGADWRITFDVNEVLAGAVPDPYVVVDAGGNCGALVPERLRAGEQVLLSTGDTPPDQVRRLGDTLVWRRVPGGWRFAQDALWAGAMRDSYPPEARTATTREAILPLVAGATVLYPTATCAAPAGPARPATPDQEPRTFVRLASRELDSLRGRWRVLPRSPFASMSGVGVWTGSRVVVVGAEERRAAAYDPTRTRWRLLARPPARLGPDAVAAWIGDEMVVVGSGRRSVLAIAYDADRDRWRRLPDAPSGLEVGTVAVIDDRMVIVAREGRGPAAGAILDPAQACWRSVAAMPEGMDDRSVVAGATTVIAVGSPWPLDGPHTVTRLDLESGTWGTPVVVPLDTPVGSAVWLGEDRFLFTGEGAVGRRAAILDLRTSTWTELVGVRCTSITFGSTAWTGRVALSTAVAFDPATYRCWTVPLARDRNRRDPVEVWTGRELVVWSGGGGEELPALPDGVAYRPPAWVRP